MGLTKKEQLENILLELNSLGGIEGSAIIAKDGLIVVSELNEDLNSESFAAMSATMFGAAETALQEIRRGQLTRVVSVSDQGQLVAMNAYEDGILVVLTSPTASLDAVITAMQTAVDEIQLIME